MRLLIPIAVLAVAARGQVTAPIPNDPLEIVTGRISAVDTPNDRDAMLTLLGRARSHYALRGDRGYDLKVSFTVDSQGQTQYDGRWEMEEIYSPQKGIRWTATAGAGYKITQIYGDRISYRKGSDVPLKLHEARGALFGPIATQPYVDRDVIRTANATLDGVELTCVLLSSAARTRSASAGRWWQESEECIDPQSGLLMLHSLAPGRYERYDYTDAPTLGSCTLPRKVTVTEAGRTVMELRVDSLIGVVTSDAELFTAPETGGPAMVLAEARKVSVFYKRGRMGSNSTIHPICVFGLITPSGQLAEAHSLQPSDSNSQAAVEAASRMKFPVPKSDRPVQRFVFITEKFVQ